MSQKSNMHGAGESERCIGPRKGPNCEGRPAGEAREGRHRTRENIGQTAATRTQSRPPPRQADWTVYGRQPAGVRSSILIRASALLSFIRDKSRMR